MKSFTALAVVASAALAQAASSPLIPTGISSGCSSFLDALNSNTTITSCLQPIISATGQFGPSSNSSSTPSASTVNSALNTLCASSSSCPDSLIRGQLASFYTACPAELTGPSANTDVIRLYDVLYAFTPMKDAACTKDDSGAYCVMSIASSTATSAAASASASSGSKAAASNPSPLQVQDLYQAVGTPLRRRASVTQNVTAALVPNTTTYRTSGLPFLFLTPSMNANALCTTCTRLVLTAYINFEQAVPYAPGIANSPMLGNQPALYSAVTSTCGSSFMSGAVQAAGGLSDGIGSSSGAIRVSTQGLTTVGSLFALSAVGVAAFL